MVVYYCSSYLGFMVHGILFYGKNESKDNSYLIFRYSKIEMILNAHYCPLVQVSVGRVYVVSLM